MTSGSHLLIGTRHLALQKHKLVLVTHIHHIESIEQQVLFDGQIEGSVSAETRTVVDLYENWSEV